MRRMSYGRSTPLNGLKLRWMSAPELVSPITPSVSPAISLGSQTGVELAKYLMPRGS